MLKGDTTTRSNKVCTRPKDWFVVELVIDRDWNSALNLLKLESVGLPIPGCGGLDVSQPVKQQVSYVNLRA